MNQGHHLPGESNLNHSPTPIDSEQPLPVLVYEPDSRVRHPIQLLQEMWQDLLASRELSWQLFKRDIQSQYRQSYLGALWLFIPPLVTAIGLTFLKNNNIINFGQTDIPYPAFVMISMTLWQTFVQVLTGVMGSARTAKTMLMKLKVPPEAFILSSVGKTLFNFLIQLIPVTFFLIWFKVKVTWSILLAPVAFIHLMAFAAAVGLLVGPLATLYVDVGKIMTFVTRVWLFVTPVIFPIPKKPLLALFIKLNPVTPLLVTTRELATTGIVTQPLGFWIASAIALIGLLIGWFFYRLAMPFIVERA